MSIGAFLTVYFLATVKILIGVGFGIGFGMNGPELGLTVFVGGMSGTAFFALAGTKIRKWIAQRRRRNGKRPNLAKARRMLRNWRKYGLIGIAILTPPFLSPPIGPVIAAAFGEKFGRIMLYIGVSMAIWCTIFGLFGQQILQLLGHQ